MRPIVFNGKFYAGGLNGVHRVADRLIRECDALLGALPRQQRPRARLMLDVLGVVPRARSAVLYNGADHIREAPADAAGLTRLGLRPRGYALLFGSAKGYKNNQVVFDAFAAGDMGVRLVVIGPDRGTLAAGGLSVPADAVFVGACDDRTLRALYEGAHSLLVPSRTEGFGLPPMEAMLCGCPAIVAPAGALPEMCRDAALYADVDDPASWRAAIHALGDDALRSAKVTAGAERARQFSWGGAGGDLLRHILRLASG